MTTEEKFWAAVDVIKSIPYDGTFEPSAEMMKKLYAYEQQATEGPCHTPKPFIWNVLGREKWSEWKSLGDMPKESAMQNYIEELSKVVETMSYNEKISRFMSLMGPFYEEVVSGDLGDAENSSDLMSYGTLGECPLNILEMYNVPPQTADHSQMRRSDPLQVSHKSFPRGFSESSSSSDLSNFDMLSELSGASAEKEMVRSLLNQKCLSEKELLTLALCNTQNTLEKIIYKFDHLCQVAGSFTDLEMSSQSCSAAADWNASAVALALLWPLAVDLCIHTLWK